MKNSIAGIESIPTRNAWNEAKPISYIGEALRTCKVEVPDEVLSAASGEAFGFTYLGAAIDEPQRDHWPNDIFADAARLYGFDIQWITGREIDDVKQIVKRAVDAGRPVLTHSLDSREHHGFHLIAGYDYEADSTSHRNT